MDDEVDKAMAQAVGHEETDPVDEAMHAASSQEPSNVPRGTFSPVQAGAAMVGGAAGAVIGGYRGLWDIATGVPAEQAAQHVKDTEAYFTPTINQATSEALASPKNPLNWIPMGAKKAGEVAQDLGASPGVATAVETGLNAIPMALGARGMLPKVGGIADTVQATNALDGILKGVDMTTKDLPPDLATKMLTDISNGAPRPDVIRAQAEAAGITRLTEGQATGDKMTFANEIESSKRGNPVYSQLFDQQSKDLMGYLDNNLGAKNAMSPADAGQSTLGKLANIDRSLRDQVNAAYGKVKSSDGRSATLDGEKFYMDAQSALERDNVTQFIPKEIASLYDEYTSGKLPLNVDTMTAFDKILSRAARTTTDGNAEHSINIIRKSLNEAPISSDAGAEAVAAYKQARTMARQRFELADPASQNYVPGYAAMLKAMGKDSHEGFQAALENGTSNADSGGWFKNNVVNATPAGAKKLVNFLNDNGAAEQILALREGMISSIKNQVVKGSADAERANLSGDALNKMLDQRRQTLGEVLPSETMSNLQRLANTATRISRAPQGAPVNWSNTSAVAHNFGQLKGHVTAGFEEAMQNSGAIGRGGVLLKNLVVGAAKRSAERREAIAGTNPPFAIARTSSSVPRAISKGVPLSQLFSSRPDAFQLDEHPND